MVEIRFLAGAVLRRLLTVPGSSSPLRFAGTFPFTRLRNDLARNMRQIVGQIEGA